MNISVQDTGGALIVKADPRSLEQWIEDQIDHLRAQQDSFGSCISAMAEIRAYKAVLRRIKGETK